MTHTIPHEADRNIVPLAIVVVIAIYMVSLLLGLPQRGTQQILAGQAHHENTSESAPRSRSGDTDLATPSPPLWTVTPFVLLLAAIAVLPLLRTTSHWWES